MKSNGGTYPTWNKEPVKSRRLTIKPIDAKYEPIYNQWELHVAAFWTHKEIEYTQDKKDWKTINDIERNMLGGVLAFFSGGDTLINGNIAEFAKMVPDDYLEVKLFWGDQMSREGIHQVTYSEMIESVCSISEKDKFFDALTHWKSIRDISNWMSVLDIEVDESERLKTSIIINICSEGIFFSAAFCFIFWFKSRGLFPGISFANEKISIDEGIHAMTAVMFYIIEFKNSNNGLDESVIHKLFREAVELVYEFVDDFVPIDFNVSGDFNRDTVKQYVRYIADFFLIKLGNNKLYNDINPFSFMNLISLVGKTNFFEKRVGDYNKADVSGWTDAEINPDLDY